jgi:hypothetical protein
VEALDELISNPQNVAQAGGLPRALLSLVPATADERKSFCSRVAEAHNRGKIDLVADFASLQNGRDDTDFFLTRQIFVDALPELTTDSVAAARTVAHLVIAAGGDMAASWPLGDFRRFLDQDPKRPAEILAALEGEPASLAILLPVVAAAGFESDRAYFLGEVIRLTNSSHGLLQRMALAALANVPVAEGEDGMPADVLLTLETAVANSDEDGALAASLSAALTLSMKASSDRKRLTDVARSSLGKGGEWTLSVAAENYATSAEKLDISLVSLLSDALKTRASENNLAHLDMGIASLLDTTNWSVGMDVLDELLRRFSKTVKFKDFQSSRAKIATSDTLRSQAVTRWLASGEYTLCEAAADAVQNVARAQLTVDVDTAQVNFQDEESIEFIARKAAGFLFFSPVAAASFLISLLRGGPVEPIKQLLLDPLLLNYTSCVRGLLLQRVETESGEVVAALRDCLQTIESYLDALGKAFGLKEVRMSDEEKAIFNRSLSQKMSKSFDVARSEMPLLSMVKRSVVLYGRGSVQRVARPDGSTYRADMMFKTQGTEITFPRMMHIDELGLHFLLRVLRAEKRVK